MKLKLIFVAAITVCLVSVKAQVSNTGFIDTTGSEHLGKISIGGYVDAYYGHFRGSTMGTGQVPYFVSSAANNEMSVNLAFIDLRFQDEKTRARFVPGFGTYMNSNYAAEPGSLKNIVEASVGFKITRKKNIWLDLGVIGSSITNESPVSKDHLMYTRSFSSENTPYYQSGARLSIQATQKLKLALYGLNGWQQIRDMNNFKSGALQVEWTINKNHLLNWDFYAGDERSPSKPLDRMRWFTDLYWIGNVGEKWKFTSCIFFGIQQRRYFSPNPQPPANLPAVFSYQQYWNANFIANRKLSKEFSLSGRVEWFNDPETVLLGNTIRPGVGFSGGSGGLCLNFKPAEKIMLRAEWRHIYSEGIIFYSLKGKTTNRADWFTTSAALWF